MNRRMREVRAALAGAAAQAPKLPRDESKTARPQVRAVSTDTTEVLMYSEIGGWFGITARQLADELRNVTTPNLHLRINSGGGDVFEAIAIHTQLRNHPATITTFIDGLAASAASYVAQAGDRVVMEQGAMMMLHDASTETWGTARDHRESADLLDKVSDNISEFYALRAGGTSEEWRAVLSSGDRWYTAQEALDAGLADEITAGVPPTEMNARLRRWRNALPEQVRAELPDLTEDDPEGAEQETEEEKVSDEELQELIDSPEENEGGTQSDTVADHDRAMHLLASLLTA